MPQTKRGIYHNLKESKYTVSNSEIVFFFSSETYRDKFLDRYRENRELFKYKRMEEESRLNFSTFADIQLYQEIEKRGFRVTVNHTELSREHLHTYSLRMMTKHHTLEWTLCNPPKLGERYVR